MGWSTTSIPVSWKPSPGWMRFKHERQGFVAMRPLFAGEVSRNPASVDAALRLPLLHPATAAMVVSLSDVRQADQAIAAAAETRPDLDAFSRAAASYA